jgi:hypothetical protein
MPKSLVVLSFAAAVGLVCSQSATAIPLDGAGVKAAATAASPLVAAQYAQHRTRHGVVKCYRDLVVGPYRCHYFRNGVLSVPF